MKKCNNLYCKIADPDNLRSAFLKAVRGKRDRSEVHEYCQNLEHNLALLREQLITEKVEVGRYRFFTVHDPKVREICAASFPERILHHAIINICEPAFERYSIFDSYGCRKGKGQQKAVVRAQQFCRSNSWYLKLDIKKYFNSIDHTILLAQLARRFKDKKLLALMETIVSSYHLEPCKGLPIGNLISQHCANFYLGVLDHWLKDQVGVKGYVRYMDDFLVFHTSKQYLQVMLEQIRDFLDSYLALRLKENIQLNRVRIGVPFLGYRVFPARITLGTQSKKRFVKSFQSYERQYTQGKWSEAALARHMLPMVEFTRFADAGAFRNDIIQRYGVFS